VADIPPALMKQHAWLFEVEKMRQACDGQTKDFPPNSELATRLPDQYAAFCEILRQLPLPEVTTDDGSMNLHRLFGTDEAWEDRRPDYGPKLYIKAGHDTPELNMRPTRLHTDMSDAVHCVMHGSGDQTELGTEVKIWTFFRPEDVPTVNAYIARVYPEFGDHAIETVRAWISEKDVAALRDEGVEAVVMKLAIGQVRCPRADTTGRAASR
jgi:hypothetical protein